MIGINLAGGNVTCSNNIVYLNSNLYYGIYGIRDEGTTNILKKIYHNTVYMSGSLSNISFTSDAAFYKMNNVGTLDLRNNVFDNARSGGSTGFHYAINLQSIVGLTIAANDYYVDGTRSNLGRINTTDYSALANWKTATGQDASSQYVKPAFYLAGSTISSDYKVGIDLDCNIITEVAIDYGMISRSNTTTMGVWERYPNKWKGAIGSMDWSLAGNWTGGRVPPEDACIEFDPAPTNHCYMDQNHSVNDVINTQSTYLLMTNGKGLTIKGELEFTNGAQIDASSSGSTIVYAGESAQTINDGAYYKNNINNLIINNVNNVTLNGTLNLLDTIKATSGKLDAITNNPTVNYAGQIPQIMTDSCYLNNKVYNLGIKNASGVTLNTDFTVNNDLVIASGTRLTIPVAKQLTVLNSITNNADVSGLIIKASSSTPNGSLIFNNNQASPVSATVEMYSKAMHNVTGVTYPAGGTTYHYSWQFFGVPLRSVTASPTFDGSYIRAYDETSAITNGKWTPLTNSSQLNSFKGYEITQDSTKIIVFQGTLENNDRTITLSNTSGAYDPGQNIISNPYTAAIDIRNLIFGPNTENTVYLYNTGSFGQWGTNNGEATYNESTNTPGQYIAIPYNTSGIGSIPFQIPSMSGFLVKATTGVGSITINYNSVITKNINPQRTPRQVKATSGRVFMEISLKGENYKDCMWLINEPATSHGFDNGWDGYKMSGAIGTPQLFAMEDSGNYQISTSSDLNNTYLGFQAGIDREDTLTFKNENIASKYGSIYLQDLVENTVIDISKSGTQYMFTAESTPNPVKRFKIVTDPGDGDNCCVTSLLSISNDNNTVFVHNKSNQKGDLYFYDMLGRVIQKVSFGIDSISSFPLSSTNGTYIVKAVTCSEKVSKCFVIKY